jgi:hypothetical protein
MHAAERSTKKRGIIKTHEFRLHGYAREFLEILSKNLFGERLAIDWMYKYLRNHSRGAPFVPEWIMGETIHIPDVRLPMEFELPREELRILLEAIRSGRRQKRETR